MPINMQYGVVKPHAPQRKLKTEKTIAALEAAQERAQEEIAARAVRVDALITRRHHLEQEQQQTSKS
ncbi:hypothetical protein AFCA_001354 [Aspergillus flavus]|nr:hypothetical protein AFCA_001354 [Aspergillus flavus]